MASNETEVGKNADFRPIKNSAKILQPNSICQSYAQMKKGQFFLTHSVHLWLYLGNDTRHHARLFTAER